MLLAYFRPISDSFDWMAGTSTGGIVALALARGFSIPKVDNTEKFVYDSIVNRIYQLLLQLTQGLCVGF